MFNMERAAIMGGETDRVNECAGSGNPYIASKKELANYDKLLKQSAAKRICPSCGSDSTEERDGFIRCVDCRRINKIEKE